MKWNILLLLFCLFISNCIIVPPIVNSRLFLPNGEKLPKQSNKENKKNASKSAKKIIKFVE